MKSLGNRKTFGLFCCYFDQTLAFYLLGGVEGFCQEKVNILKMWLVYSEIGLCKAKQVLLYAPYSHFLGPHFKSSAKAKGLLTDVLNFKFPSHLEMVYFLKK